MTFPLAPIADLFDEFELAKFAPAGAAVTSLQAVAQFQQSPSLISTDPIFFPLFLFQVKTHSESGVLFYNTGPSSNKDFVALEIWKGLPRLLLDQVTRGRYLYDVGTGRGGG